MEIVFDYVKAVYVGIEHGWRIYVRDSIVNDNWKKTILLVAYRESARDYAKKLNNDKTLRDRVELE